MRGRGNGCASIYASSRAGAATQPDTVCGAGRDRERGLPKRHRSQVLESIRRQGANGNLSRSVQGQQGKQRQWRTEMDSERRWLLQRMQQTSEGSSLIRLRPPNRARKEHLQIISSAARNRRL